MGKRSNYERREADDGNDNTAVDIVVKVPTLPTRPTAPSCCCTTPARRKRLADSLAYPPRAMRADRAAAYLDMSPASFHRLVDEGVLPRGHTVKGMVIWDRYELDAAFESLKGGDDNRNTMHKLLGIKP